MERLVRSRTARIALALGFIAFTAWAFVPYVTHRVASSAFVNAELTRITAPIGGRLTQNLPRSGLFIAETLPVQLVEATAPDRRHLVALEQQLGPAQARAELAERQLDEIVSADRGLELRTDRHRTAMLQRLARAIEEGQADLAACRAEEMERRKARGRVEQLARTGTIAQSRVEEAEAAHESTYSRCVGADARVQRMHGELAAAAYGIFLQDGYNDAPYSQQQRDRLLLRRQELEAELLRERGRALQLNTEIVAEQDRLNRLSHAAVTLPPGHVVWTLSASPGSAVVEGQPVMDLADCGRRFAVVEVPERDFEATKTGDAVMVRVLGSDEWINGRVQQVRGSAARSDERLLAAHVPSASARHITVEVALPGESLSKDGERFCHIGRLAEVRFHRESIEMLDRAATWMRELVRRLGLDEQQMAGTTDRARQLARSLGFGKQQLASGADEFAR
jgi:multidrug resistance efflux pump